MRPVRETEERQTWGPMGSDGRTILGEGLEGASPGQLDDHALELRHRRELGLEEEWLLGAPGVS
jgi:hypothetical protein